MTNPIAVTLLLLILALLVLDAAILHWDVPLVVGRNFIDFIEWASFWR